MSKKIINLFDLEKIFTKNITGSIFDYYHSGARDEVTLKNNREIFNQYEILPKFLRDVSVIDTSIDVLDMKLSHPIFLAPVAMQQMAHYDGEIASGKAASNTGTCMVLSTSSNKSMESVSKTNDNLLFQLYFAKDRSITEEILKKSKRLGFKGIVFTVDAPKLGTRERDERNNFKMPSGLILANFQGTNLEKFDNRDGSSMNMHNDFLFDPTLTFEIISWIKEVSQLPVIIKGILRPDDAEKCFMFGADGVIVSNHGGRQLDTVSSTLKQIIPIRKAIGKEKLLIVDGGIRRGTDVLKCIALGANAVQIGRPLLWGLNYDGHRGVELVISILLQEFKEAMILTGCKDLKSITGDLVRSIYELP